MSAIGQEKKVNKQFEGIKRLKVGNKISFRLEFFKPKIWKY